MKSGRILLAFAFALAAFSSHARDRNPADNLIPNGSFRSGLKGWRLDPPSAANVSMDPNAGRERAVRLSVPRGACGLISEPVNLDRTAPYFLEAFLKAENAPSVYLDVVEADGERTFKRGLGTDLRVMRGVRGWKRIQYIITPNMWRPATRQARIALMIRTAKGKPATAWLSDVFFAPGIDLDHIDSVGWKRPPGFEKAKRRYRERHILLYAPMEDESLNAAYAEGEWEPLQRRGCKLVQGKYGKAVEYEQTGGTLAYAGAQNYYQTRGAVAFWFRNGSGPEFVLTVSPTDHTFWHSMARVYDHGDKGPMQIFTVSQDQVMHGRKGVKIPAPPVGRWSHVAFVWDQRFGVKYYVNAKLMFSMWGKDAWYYNAIPAGIHFGYALARAQELNHNGSAFDELYVFDVPLTAAEIRALMRNRLEDVRGEAHGLPAAETTRHMLASAGMTPSPDLSVIKADGTTTLRVIRPIDVKTWGGAGKLRSMDGDPSTYRGGVQDLDYGKPVSITHISAIGQAQGLTAHAWSGDEFKPDRLVASIPRGKGPVFCVKALDAAPMEKLRLAFGKGGGRVGEFRAIQAGAVFSPRGRAIRQPLHGPAPLEHFGRLARPPTKHYNSPTIRSLFAHIPFSLAWEIAAQFPRSERLLLAPDAPRDASEINIPPAGLVSLFSRPLSSDLPLRAVTLDLMLAAPRFADVWLVTIGDPADQRRPIFEFPLLVNGGRAAQGGTRVRFTVDFRDIMLPAGERLWVKVRSRNGMTLRTGDGSALILHPGDREEVMREHLTDRLRLCRHFYSVGAEGHVWDGIGKNRGWRRRHPLLCLTYHKVYAHLKDFRGWKRDDPLGEMLWRRMMHTPKPKPPVVLWPKGAPGWAVYQRAVIENAAKLATWWIDNKQNPKTGGMGGGLGDDVEMVVRSWPYIYLITGDPKIRGAVKLLADGIWNSPGITDGYCTPARDVEHSAEPTSFSQPHMMLMLYGHPTYVERNMRTIKHMGWWSAYDTQGKRRIQGWAFGYNKINNRGKNRVDVPCNGRAIIPGLWVAWYNRHPLVMKWMTEYADAWYCSSREEGKGKPKWVIPNEISAETGELYRFSGRHPRSVYGGYYNEIQNLLLSVSCLTNNTELLKPFRGAPARFGAQLAKLDPNGPWVEACRKGKLSRGPVAYVAWTAGGPNKLLTDRLEHDAGWYPNNMVLMTLLEPSTDRVYSPGIDLASCMALGYYPGVRNGHPMPACTWEGAGPNTGILVARDTDTRLDVLLYNFLNRPADIVMRTWSLKPGVYALKLGPDTNSDRRMDRVQVKREVALRERRCNPVPFRLPPRRLMALSLNLIKPLADHGLELADLAVSLEDVSVSPDRKRVVARIHNIGVKPAGPFAVELRSGRVILASAAVKSLSWPADLLPRTITVKLESARPIPANSVIAIDPKRQVREITRLNNTVRLAQ